MMTSFVMNMINIIGNAICVFGLKMGVAGVAWPTLISRVAAALMMFVLIQNRNNTIRLNSWKFLIPDRHMIKNILSIGIPNGLENGMFQFGKIFLQSLVSSLGTVSIASFAVASNLVTVLYLPGNAIGLGLVTIVGQCVGAGRLKEAKSDTKSLIMVVYGILAVFSTAMVIWSGPLVGIYHLSSQAALMARELILIHSIAMVIWPLAFTIPHARELPRTPNSPWQCPCSPCGYSVSGLHTSLYTYSAWDFPGYGTACSLTGYSGQSCFQDGLRGLREESGGCGVRSDGERELITIAAVRGKEGGEITSVVTAGRFKIYSECDVILQWTGNYKILNRACQLVDCYVTMVV